MDTLRDFRIPTATVLRFVMSLALSLLVWGWVTVQRDPTVPRTFSDIAVEEPRLPEPLMVVGDPGDVTVRLEGPRSIIQAVVVDDLELQLDLDRVDGPGTYTVPIAIEVPDAVRIDQISPRQRTILVDEAASESFHLDVQTDPDENGPRPISNVTPSVSEVTVSGPKQFVDNVARVVLPIEVGERTGRFTARFTPIALNGDGERITEVEILPERVPATIEVEANGRSVPVLVQTVGVPAEGYEEVDRVVNPSTVLVDGPPAVLADLVSISTEPVAIDGATGAVSQRVALTGLPEGVTVVEPADGSVIAVVQLRERGATQSLPEQAIVVSDIPPGLVATVEPETVMIVVFASEEVMAGLRAGEITVRVSVAGLGPGTHELTPLVAVPPGVQWLRAEPETVRVTLQPTGATPANALTARPS